MLRWIGLRRKGNQELSTRILCEDFLKSLYEQSKGDDKKPSLQSVCLQAGIPEGKIAEVVGTLAIDGAIDVQPLCLTDLGRQRALSLVRAHRIYEKYLAEHSGYAPEEWHSKADKMEHSLGATEKARIATLLRNPLWDPHGDPIPTEDYRLPMPNRVATDDVEVSGWYKVLHIEDDDKHSFRQIASVGLASGSTIQVVAEEANVLTIYLEGMHYFLPKDVFTYITLARLDAEDSSVSLALRVRPLSQLKLGQTATIAGLSPACVGAMRRRLMDLGFVRGSRVGIDMRSPMGNPTAYVVRHTAIALRRDQARYILVHDVQADEVS